MVPICSFHALELPYVLILAIAQKVYLMLLASAGGRGYLREGGQVRTLDHFQPAVGDACLGTSGSSGCSNGWGEPGSAHPEVAGVFLGVPVSPVEPLQVVRVIPSRDEQFPASEMRGSIFDFPNLGVLASAAGGGYGVEGGQVRTLDNCHPAVVSICLGKSDDSGYLGGWGETTSACREVVEEFLGRGVAPVEPLQTARVLPSRDEQLLVSQMLRSALDHPKHSKSLPSEEEFLPDSCMLVSCSAVGEDNHRAEAEIANIDSPIQIPGVAAAGNGLLRSEAAKTPEPSPVAVLSTWLNDLSKARFVHNAKCKPKRSVRPHPYAQRITGNSGRSGVAKSASSTPQQTFQTPALRQLPLRPASSNRGSAPAPRGTVIYYGTH